MNTIIVTGEPRSGTSLMMNILKNLGYEILGNKFPLDGKKIDKKREERSLYLNPDGFWEVPGIVIKGISNEEFLKKTDGKAIKLVCRALLQTPKEIIDQIDKIIFCARNPREIMQSQTKLVSSIKVASKSGWKFAPELSKINYTNYKLSVGRFILEANKIELWNKILVVNYNDMLFSTEEQLEKICDFLNIPLKKEVSKIVKKDLYRSRLVKENDKLALDIYKSVLTKDFTKVEKKIKKFLINTWIKNTRWLDDTEYKTWVIAGWDLHKSLKTNNKNVRDKLVFSAKRNSLPTKCIFYNPSGREYTIRRVRQLPDLTRSKIKCEEPIFFREENSEIVLKKPRGEVTRERCFNCWQNKKIKKMIKRQEEQQ